MCHKYRELLQEKIYMNKKLKQCASRVDGHQTYTEQNMRIAHDEVQSHGKK